MAIVGSKVGWHGLNNGIGEALIALDQAGKVFAAKSTDNAGFAAQAARLARASGLPHNIIMRWTTPAGRVDDHPQEELLAQDPEAAAQELFEAFWRAYEASPELHEFNDLIKYEPTNEVSTEDHDPDKVGRFMLRLCQLLNERGLRCAIGGFNNGQPEPEHWRLPGMRALLEYVGANRQNTISLHEGKGTGDMWAPISSFMPHLIGRFTWLLQACDDMEIPRPLIDLSEWQWSYHDMPDPGTAMAEVAWLAEYLAHYPEVQGAYLWNLNRNSQWGDLPNKLTALIPELVAFNLQASYEIDEQEPPTDPQTLAQALWAEGIRRQVITYNTEAALQARIVADGYMPTDNEWRYTYEGQAYAAQGAEHPTSYNRRVYYARVPEWGDVRYVGGPGDEPGSGAVLGVDGISQRDPQWANVTLGQNTGHGLTIGSWGCLFVAYYAMARYLGIESRSLLATHAHWIGAGSFSRQYLMNHSLATAYPAQIEHVGAYDGMAPGTGELVRSYLDRGIPVVARVDFRPSTVAWEQHWVLIIGYTSADWLVMDPWTGQIGALASFYDRYGDGPGNDVLEVNINRLRTAPPPQPQPTGEARLGLHASADPGLHGGELELFTTTRPEVIKLLSNFNPDHVSQLRAQHPTARWIVRAFLAMHEGGGPRTISPGRFFQDTISDVRRTLDRLGQVNVEIELHNEPNLAHEGLGGAWSTGAQFGAWWLELLRLYREALPGRRFMFPGLSPGHGIHGVRAEKFAFWTGAIDAMRAADSIGDHVYWGVGEGVDQAIANVDASLLWLRSWGVGGRPVWLTEVGNLGTASAATKGAEYVQFWGAMRHRPQVAGLTFWVSSASSQEFTHHVWLRDGRSLGIAEIVGNR